MMRARTFPLCGAMFWVAGVCSTPALVRADETAADAAVGRAVFDEAKRLATHERWAEACTKFEESDRLLAGVGTKYNLADCYEHLGRMATAWAIFLDAAASAGRADQTERQRAATARAKALEPRLARLTIVVGDESEPGLVVTRARQSVESDPIVGRVGRGQWGASLPVDSGEYAITASAPGKETWRGSARLVDGRSFAVRIPPLATLRPPRETGDRVVVTADAHRPLAIALAGVAAAGVGIGTYFSLTAISKQSDAEPYCQGDRCLPDGVQLRADAVRAGDFATWSFVGAGVATAGAILLLCLVTSSTTKGAKTGLFTTPVALQGRF